MTKSEKLQAIAEILEVELNEISEEMKLDEFDTWDSVAVLGVIAFINEQFSRFPHASEIRAYETVGDLLEHMSE